MNKFKSLYFLFVVLLFNIGCEKDAENVELPKADPKLVIYSYISPSDSLIKVEVTKSIPFFGNVNNGDENKPVENAIVQIYSANGQKANLTFDDLNRYYSVLNDINFSITRGQTYTLSVTAPGGFNCLAKTTVPKNSPQQINVTIDSNSITSNGYSEIKYRIITKWNDVLGERNYYHNNIQVAYEYERGEVFGTNSICFDVNSDESKDGNVLTQTCIYYDYDDPNSSSSGISGKSYLFTTDINYYKYHESFYRYDGENPFSEPVIIFSNIEGGLGCFGSFIEQSVDF